MHEVKSRDEERALSVLERARTFLSVLALGTLAASALAGDKDEIKPGTWVRVQMAMEVLGDGFQVGPDKTVGRVLVEDETSLTFEVSGRKIRVPRPHSTVEGQVTSSDADTLVLQPERGAVLVVPRASIAALDVRLAPSKKGMGTAIGLVSGAAIGFVAGYFGSGSCSGATAVEPVVMGTSGQRPAVRPTRRLAFDGDAGNDCGFLFSRGDYAAIGALGGGLVGSLIGLAAAPGTKWQHVVPMVALNAGPNRQRGVEIALRLR